MTVLQGIELDFCPECRGIWLDRGELEKLIDRSQNLQPEQSGSLGRSFDYQSASHALPQAPHYPDRYKKRESWLSRLFDFD
jgi:Zn-finger nucleic acid-binding protein